MSPHISHWQEVKKIVTPCTMIWPNMTCPVLNLSWLNMKCPELTGYYMICLDVACPDMTCLEPSGSIRTWPDLAIANYCSLPSLSFGQILGKLQGKVVTHFEEVGWWRTLMVECGTLFWLFIQVQDLTVHMGLHIDQASWIYYTYQIVINFGTSVRRSSGRRSGVAVRAVDCWQWRSGH